MFYIVEYLQIRAVLFDNFNFLNMLTWESPIHSFCLSYCRVSKVIGEKLGGRKMSSGRKRRIKGRKQG